MNQKLEEEMVQVLKKLKKLSREQKEKRHAKFWADIKIPFTLDEILHKYTKNELDTIRKTLEVPNASTLRKAELVTLLQKEIRTYLDTYVLQIDKERFQLIMKIAKNGGKINVENLDDDHITYFRENGIVYTGTWLGEKIAALPSELIDSILAWDNDLHIRKIINRNTEWIKLSRGLLFYNGALEQHEFFKLLEKYVKEKVDREQCYRVLLDANRYDEELREIDFHSYLAHIGVPEPEVVHKEHQKRRDLAFYPFTKNQLLQAGEPFFTDKNKSYQRFVHYLLENFDMTEEEADELTEDCAYAIRAGEGLDYAMELLGETLELPDRKSLEEMTDNLTYFMNNTRQWFLKGHTPTELYQKEKGNLQPVSKLELPSNPHQKKRKIGRNEPCPCGSGKKYKKCCLD